MDVNQDYLQERKEKWTDDGTLRVEAQFRIDSASETAEPWTRHYGEGDIGIVSKAMAVNSPLKNGVFSGIGK